LFALPRISERLFTRVGEELLRVLYEHYPKSLSTHEISWEVARDDEFCLRVLQFLESNRLVSRKKNSEKPRLWRLSEEAWKRYDEARK
jgi:DNA-binding IclR family transcriptional regulator